MKSIFRLLILPLVLLLLHWSVEGDGIRRTIPIVDDSINSISLCGSTHVFLGEWETFPLYPLFVGEAQGGMIGHDLVVMGGFYRDFATVAVETYAYNTTTATNQNGGGTKNAWRRMDDFPIAHGVTHAAFAIHQTKLYVCGGYGGGHPGPAVDDCFVYDHSIAPGQGKQWTRLPSLLEPRAGGGMTYDTRYQILVFAGGATRPVAGVADAIDHDTTWILAPDTPEYGWQEQASFPLLGNHLSFVTAVDKNGNDRHWYFGGQKSEQENNGNLNQVYEYKPLSDRWIERHAMPFPRGHASSSTVPYGCGFLVAGGAVNGNNGTRMKTDDISYYDIATDSWTHLGSMYMAIKTPVCGIHANYLYCTSGYTRQSLRRKLGVAETTV